MTVVAYLHLSLQLFNHSSLDFFTISSTCIVCDHFSLANHSICVTSTVHILNLALFED